MNIQSNDILNKKTKQNMSIIFIFLYLMPISLKQQDSEQ